ncbi:hypothetical protein TD95_000616 [Thielaviopsis punctulata]|uniref:BTB domain-containing protein n=1 Tax=Thielaviopsis punctulata TaxID=72032 RepID=A0A0F4ZK23_9PEZI|nr:hypothetical protein TD95_000616 [Thielaviopsis punctulata]
MATSANLWRLFWDQDIDGFSRLLATSTTASGTGSFAPGSYGKESYLGSSPLGRPSSLTKASKSRKGQTKNQSLAVSKAEINSRDHAGLTLLLRAAVSTGPLSISFVRVLLQHPAIDLYAQDTENGWNALHRALYAGNISIARLLLETEETRFHNDILGTGGRIGSLIKTKDREGNSPFDLYLTTISVREITRDLKILSQARADNDHGSDHEADDSDDDEDTESENHRPETADIIFGDEVFMFGSNKNNSLGVGDGDDRQYPERIQLDRPENIIKYFHTQYLESVDLISDPARSNGRQVPQMIRSKPLVIRDVVLSKFHSAILTDDPFANLYISGVGRGGRLGLGDENTQFRFVPLQGPLSEAKIIKVALGQNHSMAVTSSGALWTWGSNSSSQLGYILPPSPNPDGEPVSLYPRQVFGTLKKEFIIGAAASAIHSVAYTATSLFCWGSNQGQLALMDSDSRSLKAQVTPRKVAASLFSSPIKMVCASDKATTCLLQNHTVVVFTNYGYNIVNFPVIDILAGFGVQGSSGSKARNKRKHGQTTKVDFLSSGGDTVAALTATGEVYIINMNATATGNNSTMSTTNPAKIRSSVSPPQRIWHARKDAATSAGVGENGSVILCTESGAVWRRVTRELTQDNNRKGDSKRDAFKFQRVPTLTGAVAVRGSPFGAFAAVRSDTKVTKDLISVQPQSLWADVGSLFPLQNFTSMNTFTGADALSVFQALAGRKDVSCFVREVLKSSDIESDLARFLGAASFDDTLYDALVWTSSAPNLRIPVHSWLLAARSRTFRACISKAVKGQTVEVPDFFSIQRHNFKMEIEFQNLDIYGLLNLVTIAYTDSVVPIWNHTRLAPHMAHRYRQVRSELMKLASKLGMDTLEAAARSQVQARPSMNVDFRHAICDSRFFDSGNVLLKLNGKDILVHRDMMCQRCPWFHSLFKGHSHGAWLKPRLKVLEPGSPIVVDFSHIDPKAFEYVLEHIYSDVGTELFDDVVTASLDEFGELVYSVMEIANEFMLDRLIEVCQSVLGRFVTMRNVATILNKVDITYISSFKTASLEYVCLQLEGFLENHLLDHMDDALLEELDNVVRQNQLAAQPFARSQRLEALFLLHEHLKADIEEERRIRCQELAWKALPKADFAASSGPKARQDGLEVPSGLSPFAKNNRKKVRDDRDRSSLNTPRSAASPDLRATEDDDMMFEMDMDPLTPMPPSRSKDSLGGESLGKGKMKKLNLKREPLVWDRADQSSSFPPPAAPWASQGQNALDSQITMITEAMEDAALDDESGWQSVSKTRARKQSISSPPMPSHFYSGSPSIDHEVRPAINMPLAKAHRTSTSAQSPTSMQSLPSRPLNLGSLLPGASASPPESKLKMKLPPPPTVPPPSLSAIFNEQEEERQRKKDLEQARSRPLHEIQAEQEFEQWWREEQLKMKQRARDNRKSEQLIQRLLAQENACASGSSSSNPGGGKSRGNNSGKGKSRASGSGADAGAGSSKTSKSKEPVYPKARSWAETTSFIPGQLAHEQFGITAGSSQNFSPFPRDQQTQSPLFSPPRQYKQEQKQNQQQKHRGRQQKQKQQDSSKHKSGGSTASASGSGSVPAPAADSNALAGNKKQHDTPGKKGQRNPRGSGSGGPNQTSQQKKPGGGNKRSVSAGRSANPSDPVSSRTHGQ